MKDSAGEDASLIRQAELFNRRENRSIGANFIGERKVIVGVGGQVLRLYFGKAVRKVAYRALWKRLDPASCEARRLTGTTPPGVNTQIGENDTETAGPDH
jgi:hypothetical protein